MSPAAVPFQAERHTKRKRGLRPETERDSQWRRSAGDGIVFFFLCPVFNFCTQKVTEQDLRFLLRFISLYCWLVGSFFFCFVLATKFGQKKKKLGKITPVCLWVQVRLLRPGQLFFFLHLAHFSFYNFSFCCQAFCYLVVRYWSTGSWFIPSACRSHFVGGIGVLDWLWPLRLGWLGPSRSPGVCWRSFRSPTFIF